MALIGSITNYGSLTGEINNFNGAMTGFISSSQLMGGEVVGMRGLPGEAATITVGSTTTGAAGTNASVTNSGTQYAAVLDFTIPKGDKGDTGDAATITVGSTTTGNPGTSASVSNSGTSGAAVLDFTIPRGDKGETGTAATVAVGTTTTGAAGTSASVTNSGTSSAAVFNFTIPKGDKGDQGNQGNPGTAATISVGTVTTGDPDDPATVSNSGTSSAAVFDFTIPKGDKGDQGDPGDVSDVEVNGTSVVTAGVASVTVPTTTSQLTNNSLFARGHIGAFHGTCTTAAGTATKVVTCADFTSADLVAGAMIVVSFSNANSAAVADLKLDVNGTGAYGIRQNNSGTLSNVGDKSYLKASSYPFIFNGSYWICWYDTNTNTIGYTIRTNGLTLPVKTACYRYRICFTSPDGKNYVPANASTSTSSTASKTVTTEKIDPFGRIIYYSYTTALSAGGTIGASYQMQQYNGVTLGYSFNTTGVALTMTSQKAVYVKCTPQTDGSAIIDSSTPFVQDLPTTEDGKIYIFLGIATSATAIEFTLEHPVYYYKDGGVRLWTNASFGSGSVTDVTQNGTSVLDGTVAKVVTHDVPSGGSSGQVLAKSSGTDYDLAWTTVSGGGDVVYATSSDSASTVAKTATIVSGTLSTLSSGVQAIVKFAESNTASSPTLNIGGTGAKSIKRYGTTAVGQNQNESWVAGSPVLFVYDGTNWVISGWLNTTYSGGTASGITTGTDNLNYIWSPKQIHDGIVGLADANVQSDWNEADNTKDDYIKNKPTIPTVNNATLTIQKNSTNVATFTANASSNVTADISVPTNVSDLNNDSGYITGVTSTSTPTASTISEFDSNAKMNSTDMSSADVSSFIAGLNTFPAEFVEMDTPFYELDTSAQVGTTDYALYNAITSLGWDSDIVGNDVADIKVMFTKILDLLKYETATATKVGSYYSSGSITCYKRCGVVTVKCQALVMSQLSARTTVATLPSGFRPPNEVFTIVSNTSSTERVLFDADGKVKFEPCSSATYYASVTFVAGGN